jgi:hypothetical protein
VTALHTDDSEGHMPQRDTPVRSLHDIGLAAWFGGSLMGAVELNGAAATVKGPKERISVATGSIGLPCRWHHLSQSVSAVRC